MSRNRFWTASLLGGLLAIASVPAVEAQSSDQNFTLEARGGVNVPTFDIRDAADAGPSFGVGAGIRVSPKLWLLADADFGFHSGAELPGGAQGPDVNVYHYIGKVGYELISPGTSRWSVIVNAGAGAMTFDVDGGGTETYPAINVGAKIAYQLSPKISFLLSPQGDIAFSDEDILGTDNSWVWPFTAGLRVGF